MQILILAAFWCELPEEGNARLVPFHHSLPAFFDLLISLGQKGLIILHLKMGPLFQNGLSEGEFSYTLSTKSIRSHV